MKQPLLAFALCLAPIIVNAGDEPVPIEQEPRHKLVFANEHVRYFDVELEPGYESRYHWHRADGVFVNISSSPTIAQDLDKEPVRRGGRAIGETYYIDYGAKPKAHRVSNPGTTPYHVIDTEILGVLGLASDLGHHVVRQEVLAQVLIRHGGSPPCCRPRA